MAARKSSLLKKLEERRAATRPPIDASALVARRPRPVSRPSGVAATEEEVQAEEREVMRALLSPPAVQPTPAEPEALPKSPPDPDTVSKSTTVSESDTVSKFDTVSESNTVSDLDTVFKKDTVSNLTTASESITVSKKNTVSKKTPVSLPPKVRPAHAHPDIAELLSRNGNTPFKPEGGYTTVLWAVDDVLAAQQTPSEQAVYRQLYRLSYGFGNTHCFVGYDALQTRCNLSKSALRMAVKGLTEKRHIAIAETINEKTVKGTVYRVFLPPEIRSVASLLGKSASEAPARKGRDAISKSDTVLFSDTVSKSNTVSGSDTVSDSHTVLSDTVSESDTVLKSDTIITESTHGVRLETKPDLHPVVVPGSVRPERSNAGGENRVRGNTALKLSPSSDPKPDTAPVTSVQGYLTEAEEAYLRTRTSSEQSDIFDARDAWDAILGAETRPVASKLNEMLTCLRASGYEGNTLIKTFRRCLEKTKGRADDPVAWMISALKKGRYP